MGCCDDFGCAAADVIVNGLGDDGAATDEAVVPRQDQARPRKFVWNVIESSKLLKSILSINKAGTGTRSETRFKPEMHPRIKVRSMQMKSNSRKYQVLWLLAIDKHFLIRVNAPLSKSDN